MYGVSSRSRPFWQIWQNRPIFQPSWVIKQCNMPHKMEHAGIALGTTVGLSVPIYQPCYLLQTPVTPADQTGAAMLSLVIRDVVSRNRHKQ